MEEQPKEVEITLSNNKKLLIFGGIGAILLLLCSCGLFFVGRNLWSSFEANNASNRTIPNYAENFDLDELLGDDSDQAMPAKTEILSDLGISIELTNEAWEVVRILPSDYTVQSVSGAAVLSVSDFTDSVAGVEAETGINISTASNFNTFMNQTYGGDYRPVKNVTLENGFGIEYEIAEESGFSYILTIGDIVVLCETSGGFVFQFEDSKKVCESIKMVEGSSDLPTPAVSPTPAASATPTTGTGAEVTPTVTLEVLPTLGVTVQPTKTPTITEQLTN